MLDSSRSRPPCICRRINTPSRAALISQIGNVGLYCWNDEALGKATVSCVVLHVLKTWRPRKTTPPPIDAVSVHKQVAQRSLPPVVDHYASLGWRRHAAVKLLHRTRDVRAVARQEVRARSQCAEARRCSVSNSLVGSFLLGFIGRHESNPKPTARHQELCMELVRFTLVPIFHRLDDAVEDTQLVVWLDRSSFDLALEGMHDFFLPRHVGSASCRQEIVAMDCLVQASGLVHESARHRSPPEAHGLEGRTVRSLPPLCSVARAAHALYKLSHHASSLAGLGWRLHEHFALDAA